MAYQSIGLGSTADDGTGDTLRNGGDKVNDNFVELYTLLGNATTLSSGISATATVITLTAPTISGIVGGTQTSATITTLTTTTVTASGVITGSTVEATGDTAADDNAAIGYTSVEGLILTGQGSTNDVTIKNDADAAVISIPTGTTTVSVTGSLLSSADNSQALGSDANRWGSMKCGGTVTFGWGNAGTAGLSISTDADTGLFRAAADTIGFTAGGTERLRIDAAGLKFNGDTATANALDDYEEGTWTPTFVSSSATFAYATQGGTYTKVGRICTVSFRLALSGSPGGTTSNSCFIGGLPFAIASLEQTYHGGHPGFYFNINLAQAGSMAYQLSSGASTVELKNIGDNIGETAVLASYLGSAAEIRGQLVYQTA